MTQRINAEVELIRGTDGTWLAVKASDGKQAMLNLDQISNAPIVKAAVQHWADEQFNKANGNQNPEANRGDVYLMPCVIRRSGQSDKRVFSFATNSPNGFDTRTVGISSIEHFRNAQKTTLSTAEPAVQTECFGFIYCTVLLVWSPELVKIELPDGTQTYVRPDRLRKE